MAEEIKPPVEVKPAVPAKVAVKEPTNEELKAQLLKQHAETGEQLARLQALEDKESDFGPKKAGKRKFKIPAFPPEWKMTTLKTINVKGKTVYHPGRVYECTFDEIDEIKSRISQRARFETFARTAQQPIDLDLTSSGGTIF